MFQRGKTELGSQLRRFTGPEQTVLTWASGEGFLPTGSPGGAGVPWQAQLCLLSLDSHQKTAAGAPPQQPNQQFPETQLQASITPNIPIAFLAFAPIQLLGPKSNIIASRQPSITAQSCSSFSGTVVPPT